MKIQGLPGIPPTKSYILLNPIFLTFFDHGIFISLVNSFNSTRTSNLHGSQNPAFIKKKNIKEINNLTLVISHQCSTNYHYYIEGAYCQISCNQIRKFRNYKITFCPQLYGTQGHAEIVLMWHQVKNLICDAYTCNNERKIIIMCSAYFSKCLLAFHFFHTKFSINFKFYNKKILDGKKKSF